MYVKMFLLKCVAFWLVFNSYVICHNNLRNEVKFDGELAKSVNELIKEKDKAVKIVEEKNKVDVADTVDNVLNGVTEILVGIKQKNYFAILLGITSTIDFIGTLFAMPALVTPIVKIIHSILSLAGVFKKAPAEDKFESALQEKDIRKLQEDVLCSIQTVKLRVSAKTLDQILLDTSVNRIKIETRIKDYCGFTKEADLGKCITLLELLSTYTKSQTMLAILLDKSGFKKIQENIKEYRNQDKKTLEFLYNFENTRKSQQVILAELYRHPEKFATVNYLKSLDKEFNLYRKKTHIFACDREWLQGTCSIIWGPQADTLKNNNLKSMFIPPEEEVVLVETLDYGHLTGFTHTVDKIGPFKGMSVYSSKKTLGKYLKVKMTVIESMDASNYVRVCRKKGWCDTITSQDGSLEILNGISWKEKQISSIFVPEGMKVEYGTLKSTYASKKPIVIFGPNLVEGLEKCGSKHVSEYYMEITESGSTSVTKESLKKEKGKIYHKKVKDIESHPGDMALLCSKKYGMGICLQQGETKQGDLIYSDLKNRQCKFNVKSINIPRSLCVTIKPKDKSNFTKNGIIHNFDNSQFTIIKIYPAKSYETPRCH